MVECVQRGCDGRRSYDGERSAVLKQISTGNGKFLLQRPGDMFQSTSVADAATARVKLSTIRAMCDINAPEKIRPFPELLGELPWRAVWLVIVSLSTLAHVCSGIKKYIFLR